MKNKLYISLLFLAGFLSSCSSDLDTENVSLLTSYAVFDYEPIITIPLGGTFTPNAAAEENGNSITVSNTGTVDTNTVGIYDVSYSATNSDGFAASAPQTVIVHDPAIIGSDVSGAIVDANNATRTGEITLVDGTSSIFYVTDFGFGGAFPMYFQMNGDVISEIQPQTYALSAVSVDLTYDPTTRQFTTLIYDYGFSYTFNYQ